VWYPLAVRVHAVQFDIVWENPPANQARVRELTGGLPAGGLIVLPEMFATGFSFDRRKTAGSADFVQQLARERGCHVVAGLVSEDGQRNEAVAVDPAGRVLARYAKLHPFLPGGEPYTPGTQPVGFACGELVVAPFLCFDLRFPEDFRAVRADLYLVLANWPHVREDHWLTLLRARAIENQAYVVGVNRVGRDPNHAYGGRSQIISPRGEVLADAGQVECVVSVEISAATARQYRQEFPLR
jgi:predicted amidohydrolase